MGQREVHLRLFETFRADADRPGLSPNSQVEGIFLAAYHRIDASAARLNVHIGKHQNVRKELELNQGIFDKDTREVWRAFQDLETRIRPMFVYGQAWTKEDLDLARTLLDRITTICDGHDRP